MSEVLDNVRLMDGCEDFLLPRSFSSLQAAAKMHLVVFLISNNNESDCLIMTSTDLHHISLPRLPTKTLQALNLLTSLAASQAQVPLSHIKPIDGIQAILTLGPTEAILDHGDLVEPDGHGGGTVSLHSKTLDECFKHILEFLWKELVKPVVNYLKLQVRHLSCYQVPIP